MGNESRYLREAIGLARVNIRKDGRPFGALVVLNDEVIATGINEILSANDPTAHAELSMILKHVPVLHEQRPNLYFDWSDNPR